MDLKKFYDAAQAAEARVQKIAAQINDLFEEGQNDEGIKLRPSLDAAKASATEASQMYISMLAASQGGIDPAKNFVPMGGDPEPKSVKDMRSTPEYAKQFFAALREGVSPKNIRPEYEMLANALTEAGGSPAGSEGGFVLPIDFDNMIIELKRGLVDFSNYFNVEFVNAFSGWRAIETSAAELPFAKIVVAAGLAESESPTFTKVEYTLEDYGGYLPVSNGLLQDTPTNIMAYLARYYGRKEVLTVNSLILALINAISPTAVTDYKKTLAAIKTVLNKTLDPAASASANVFTNQSGLDLLDQLDDGTGRPLLQPDPSKETEFRVKGRPVVVLADSKWALTDTSTKTRIAIGDGKQYATLFRKPSLAMDSTTVGGDAWRKNSTEVRGIMRANAKEVDAAAMKLLSVTLPV